MRQKRQEIIIIEIIMIDLNHFMKKIKNLLMYLMKIKLLLRVYLKIIMKKNNLQLIL